MKRLLISLFLFIISESSIADTSLGQNDIYGITISGGVSLGAYESGFTYYMTNIS